MVEHIAYEPLPQSEWWDAEVVFIEVEILTPEKPSNGVDPSRGVLPAPPGGANLFDGTIYDSHVERTFASILENAHDQIKLYTKLPRRFRVRTPVGDYSPDWAIVYEVDGTTQLYLVRETKDTLNLSDLEWDEAMRIRFAQRHFAASPTGPVDFTHTTDHDGVRVELH